MPGKNEAGDRIVPIVGDDVELDSGERGVVVDVDADGALTVSYGNASRRLTPDEAGALEHRENLWSSSAQHEAREQAELQAASPEAPAESEGGEA